MGEQRLARTGFERFAADAEPRLRIALVATYGPVDGRSAAVDALSWAWEHWDRLQTMDNPVGYLYRVGQSAVRRNASRPLPPRLLEMVDQAFPEITPELLPALARLSPQQRSVVVLIHAFGWTQRDVAAMLGISPSTVREHLDRAVTRLREELEVRDAH
jgi:DNA-directed RNA polymerase specialized sigma24 family protein